MGNSIRSTNASCLAEIYTYFCTVLFFLVPNHFKSSRVSMVLIFEEYPRSRTGLGTASSASFTVMAIASARRAGRRLSSRPSSKKANAIGFAKRRSRSVKAAVGLSDVYDFVPSKSKRGSVSLLLDKDEARSGKYDEDEDDSEIDDSRRKPRLVGEGDEDEQIASDEDEEIDSDDAFEESDEERYAGFDFKKVCTSYLLTF